MSDNIFTELKSRYEFLTRVEKQIADLILRDPQTFITYSMSELSTVSGVSQGSINNFSKKFSSGGYSSLKLKVARCLSSHQEKPFTAVDGKKGIRDAMKLCIAENIEAFRNTLELNDDATMKRVVDAILTARKIELYGIFDSGIVAKDFCYQLIQLGIPATFVDDSLMCAVSASMLDKEDLVIVISSTGRTKEMLDAIEIAKKNSVPVVLITANRSSPLAKMADNVLLAVSSGTSVSGRSAEIRFSKLLLVDTLCAYIRSVIDKGGQRHYYKLQEILNSHSVKDSIL